MLCFYKGFDARLSASIGPLTDDEAMDLANEVVQKVRAERWEARQRRAQQGQSMFRGVADPNVLVSADISTVGVCGRLLTAAESGKWQPVVSPDLPPASGLTNAMKHPL